MTICAAKDSCLWNVQVIAVHKARRARGKKLAPVEAQDLLGSNDRPLENRSVDLPTAKRKNGYLASKRINSSGQQATYVEERLVRLRILHQNLCRLLGGQPSR